MYHNNIENESNLVAEPAARTYGMSEALTGSDLLSRIRGLSLQDKRCLLRYIEDDVLEADDDALWDSFPRGVLFNPYEHTQEEIAAYIDMLEEETEQEPGVTHEQMMVDIWDTHRDPQSLARRMK